MSDKSKRELMFSVTAADCRFDYLRGSGAGGQKRNKTNSAVRCTHLASKAVGYCEESRSQHENKRTAFERMAKTKEFGIWHKIEVSRRTGELERIERKVDQEMKNVVVEIKDDNGRWVKIDKNATLPIS